MIDKKIKEIIMDIDLHRVKIIHDEIDRCIIRDKISMIEVEMAFRQIQHEWTNSGRPEPDHRDNYQVLTNP